MSKIVVYQKPTCTTCRKVHAALKERGVDFDSVNYYTDSLPKKKIKELLNKMDMPASGLLRTNEPLYKELGLAYAELSDEQLIDLMVRHPDLIQRPIIEKGPKAILARPAERVSEII